jgi:hypothetical protein
MVVCGLCNAEYKNKRSLDIHLNRKNKCNIKTPYQCGDCNKYFKQNKNLQEHIIKQTCKSDKESNSIIIADKNKSKAIKSILQSSIDVDSQVLLLKNYNINLNEKSLKLILSSDMDIDGKLLNIQTLINNIPTTSSINNSTINLGTFENSNNVTNNIQINNFGKEDLSYLDKEYFKNLIMTQHIEKGYVQLIKDIYLNKEHPENGTIKVENINNKYAHVYNNGKWDTILKYDLREQIHKKNYTILKMNYNKLKNAMSPPKKEETVTFLARDEISDPHMMYVIDKIILLFYNDGEGEDLPDKYKIGKNII